MMSKLDRILDDCLDRLARGESTLEECLARHPAHAEELHRLLLAATSLDRGRETWPSAVFKERARSDLMAHMSAHPREQANRRWFGIRPSGFSFALGRTLNFASGLAAILLLVLMTGTVLAQMALPGDALYSWRLASEQVWRTLHPHSLVADLTLADRHARDLASVAGNEQAESLARRDYRHMLEVLSIYTTPIEQRTISESLSEHKANLVKAQMEVPELDRLLATVATRRTSLALEHAVTSIGFGRIAYSLTITNQGPAEVAAARLVDNLSPLERFASAEGADCAVEGGEVTCMVENLALAAPRMLTLTTTIDRCYTGTITNTAVITGAGEVANINPDNQATVENNVTHVFPQPARVVYVQSNGHAHSLALVTAGGWPIDSPLPAPSAAPAWSPDGTKIAFFGEEGISELGGVYTQGNGVWIVETVDSEGWSPRQLIAQDHVKNLAWSPDGTRLALEVGPPDQSHEVWLIDANDGRQLSRFPGEQPAWSPDGQRLVVRDCAPGCGLWLVDANGQRREQITFGDSDSYPAWSPVGEYLVFASERDGNWDVYRRRWADGQLLPLTQRPGTDTTPAFDGCGQQLFLRTDHYGSWWITVMKLDGSDERKVKEGVGASDDWGLARPAAY